MASECKSFKFPNGLKCLVYSNKCFKGANVSLFVHCGSRNEVAKREFGISHLLEHMMFKGTKRRPNGDDISKAVYRLGGSTNAFTGVEITGYYISVPCDKIGGALDILSDMMYCSLMRDKDIQMEKKVVVNELKQRESNPAYVVANLVNETVFKGLTLGKKIGGDIETVNGISKRDIMRYLGQYYVANNMTLVLVGDKSVRDMEKLGRKYFGKELPWGGNGVGVGDGCGCVCDRGSELGKDFYMRQGGERVKVVKSGLDHAFICFAFPMDVMTSGWFTAAEVMGNIMAGNMMSRLFVELREKRGLVYNVKFMMDMYRDGGTFMITLSTHNRGWEIQEVIKVVLEEMKKIKRSGVSEKELKVFKDFILGNWSMTLNDADEMAEFFGIPAVLCGKVQQTGEYKRKVKRVSCADVKEAACKLFREKALNLCVLGRG